MGLSEALSGLEIGPSMGVAFFLMVATVWIVNQIKRLLARAPWSWTKKVPDETWIALSVVIPAAVCVVFNWDLIESIIGTPIAGVPSRLLNIASGAVVGIAGQATYGSKKMLKSAVAKRGIATTRDFSPGVSSGDKETGTEQVAQTPPATQLSQTPLDMAMKLSDLQMLRKEDDTTYYV